MTLGEKSGRLIGSGMIARRDALVLEGDGEGEHVVVDDLRPSAVVALGGGDDLAFEGFLPDVVAFDLSGDGEDGEEHGAHAVGVVDAGERAGEEFELDAAGLELGGERHEFGVAGEALELVDGEDDGRLGRGFLELVGQRERLLQLGPDLDAGADLLLEDLVAFSPPEGFELARQLLAGG